MFRTILKKMLSALLALTTLSASVSGFLSLPRVPSKDKTVDLSKFTLVWSDEFDGTELDRSKWGYEWWVTERKGGYWHEDMVSVRDGNLVISAQYFDEPLENRYYDQWHEKINFKPYRAGWYTGQVVTRDKYEQCYGYFECRCILPAATGLWSAFWMMNEGVFNVDGSGQDGTEVDVFESFYYKDHWWGADAISTGIHYDGYGEGHHGDSIGKWYLAGDPYKEYNTYGVEWNPDEYIFYINGHETGRLSTGGVSQNPEYLLLSVEFGGKDGVQSSDRTSTGKISKTPKENWPAEFIVDYVRCYQYNEYLPTITDGDIILK
ncbi:MAG: glycoside hydrolase family 16 protein [Clostridia bacterium]|nr:glycoside hydrolase family 16 protein [Clostridia bacterium]MBR3554246.1 glycoside hydrolase family 16 protein [Clostridia bacterium]